MRRNTQVLSVLVIAAIVVTAFSLYSLLGLGNYSSQPPSPPPQPPPGEPPYQKILLSRFPISLDKLFWMDNTTERNLILNDIKMSTSAGYAAFIIPYPNYFSAHQPASFKWYMYVRRSLPISLSVDTYFSVRDETQITEVINGTTLVWNVGVDLLASPYISYTYGHVYINKSLCDACRAEPLKTLYGWKDGRWVFVPANTVVGYTLNSSAMDFVVEDKTVCNYAPGYVAIVGAHMVNPFFYFTQDVQNDIAAHYQVQYDAMKQRGLYVESRINRTLDINDAGTFFGIWWYKAGYLTLNSSHHQLTWYSFDASTLDILNVSKADRETFYKDVNTGSNFTGRMMGVYSDAYYEPGVQGYTRIGMKYMYYEYGDFSEGIVHLTNLGLNVRPGPIYMKYQLIQNASSMYGDLLRVDYFNSFAEAQGPFTAYNLTYARLTDASLMPH